MKKLVLSAVVLTTVVMSVTAQTKNAISVEKPATTSMPMSSPTAKGKWLVGPALSFSSYNNDNGTSEYKHNLIGLHPEIAYFISENVSTGLMLGFGMEKNKVDGIETDKASSLYLSPTLRYYIPLSAKFKFIGKLQIPVSSVKQTLTNGNPVDIKNNGFGVELISAFAFFPSNKISIELDMGGLYYHASKTDGIKSSSLDLKIFNNNKDNSGIIQSPTLGVKWHLGK